MVMVFATDGASVLQMEDPALVMSCVSRSVLSVKCHWIATSWKMVVKWLQAYHNPLVRLLDVLLTVRRVSQGAVRGW